MKIFLSLGLILISFTVVLIGMMGMVGWFTRESFLSLAEILIIAMPLSMVVVVGSIAMALRFER